jgi:hypothetical protein
VWLLSVVSLITVGAIGIIIGLSRFPDNLWALILTAAALLVAGGLLIRRTGALRKQNDVGQSSTGADLARKLGGSLGIDYLPN